MTGRIDMAAILALPSAERLALAETIWESVTDDEIQMSPAQTAELERRLARHLAEPTAGTPWEEVAARVRDRVRSRL